MRLKISAAEGAAVAHPGRSERPNLTDAVEKVLDERREQ
jgi:hypothetical protein